MANLAFQLVVRKGPQPGQIIPLSEDAMSIGRDPSSNIVIDDPEISRHHARLHLGPSGYVLQDMASTNGSFVEGQRLGGEPVALSPGQVLMFGSNVTIVYEALPAPDPMATIVAPASVSYDEEILPEEPVVEEIAEDESPEPVEADEEEIIPEIAVPLVLDIEEEDIVDIVPSEPFDIEEEEIIDEVAVPLVIETEEVEEIIEVESPEPLDIEEAEIVAAVAAIEALEIEEEESIEEVVPPESLEKEEDIAAVAAVAALEAEEVEELEEIAEDEDEDLPTIIDSPVVVAEPIAELEPEPEAEVEEGMGFPSFDDVEPEPDAMIEEEPEPPPYVFEEPAPEPEVFKEPEPAPAFVMDPTEPDVDFQPVMAAQPEMEAPFEEPRSGRSNRPVIIGVVLFVLMCCCIIGLILVLVTIDTWVKTDLIEGLDLAAVWFFRGVTLLAH